MANVETITACENMCRDFGTWFPQFMSVFADFGTGVVGGAAIFAFFQLNTWRKQKILEARADLSSRLLALALRLADTIRMFQMPHYPLTTSESCLRAIKFKGKILKENPEVLFEFSVALAELELLAAEGNALGLWDDCNSLRDTFKWCEMSFITFRDRPDWLLQKPDGLKSPFNKFYDDCREAFQVSLEGVDGADPVGDCCERIKSGLKDWLIFS